MVKNIGVYQIELNGKIYVGSSASNIKQRWACHVSELRKGKHRNIHLQRAYNKHGEESLRFSIIEVVETPEECIIAEQKHIDELAPDYNICQIAGNCLGTKRSDDFKNKRRKLMKGNKINLGRKQSEEYKQKTREATKGIKKTEEFKKKISEKMAGNKNCVGRKYSEETKQKMRDAWIRRRNEKQNNII